MTAARKEYSYDSACEILAEYFLGQPRSPDEVKALAQHVQDAVEAWFVEKNGWFVATHDDAAPQSMGA